MPGHIIGWAHTRFGKLDDETLESLVARVSADAVADSGLDPADIDEVFVGHFNQGMVPQGFPASLVLQGDAVPRFTPVTRVENACATGSAALRQAAAAIGSGQARAVLVVGVETMTAASAEQVRTALVSASYVREEGGEGASFAGIFGRIADLYFQRHGDRSEALARIAAKNHRNGAANPLAHMRKDLGFDFCNAVSEKNPIVAGPLRRTDCSMVSDGAAALVLAHPDVAATVGKAVALRAQAQVNDFLPLARRDIVRLEGCAVAWARALERAGLTLADLDFVETHDCFTIAELIEYEAMGLTGPGQGHRAIMEGWTEIGGRLPVNPSGGLKAKGHPIGATGVSMHVMAAMQLADAPVGLPVPGAAKAGIFNMGGAGVANYVSILERVR
ncbi:acetyl-CoA acetyltransferase [Azospirillum sp. RWY-5-1]|uniref:Acetyl-CoA acetyltransferase n=1 Tax=Azospirillum oleiclasticum TaxID=2735135 RepID=A0ABX2TFW7_9PROT|nr:acetyl-CoA acetyltransferase [Azospirillum oleiclasticum]NYZ14414.1 acetyl-CoA acetyltransferase [Azospirillum oleiclasticum]NYZ23234.1 acetyl-CoA acetyltransferase [Azospirillum oleiclasticum]